MNEDDFKRLIKAGPLFRRWAWEERAKLLGELKKLDQRIGDINVAINVQRKLSRRRAKAAG